MANVEKPKEDMEQATFKELRDIREVLGQVRLEDRSKIINLLDSAGQAGFTFQDLIDILEEDCGQYQGSWVQPANVERE